MLAVIMLGAVERSSIGTVKGERAGQETRLARVFSAPPKANILWLEDFEGGFPGSMSTYKLGNPQSRGWVAYSQSDGFGGGPMGNESAAHNDDDVPSDSCDDWLVSPAVTLPDSGNPIYLTFYHGTQYAPTYTRYRGVWVSTGSGDPSDGDFVELLDLSDSTSEDAWTKMSLDLSAYAGQTVYIAFRYVGDYSDEWYLDSVMVWENVTYANDLAVEVLEPVGVVSFGESVTPRARAKNLGQQDSPGATVVFNLYDWRGTVIYSDTQSAGSLPSGDSVDLGFSSVDLSEPGPYRAEALLLEADDNPSNDTSRSDFGLVQFTYTARVNSYASPVIDGVLDDEVWQSVDTLDISDFLGAGGEGVDTPGLVLFMASHNYDTLFLAFVVKPDTLQDQYDQVSFGFDDNNDDQWPASDTTEGLNGLIPGGWFYAWFNQGGWSGWQSLSESPPYGMDYSSGYLTVEVAVPIVHEASGDVGPWTLLSGVSVGFSDTVGLILYEYEGGDGVHYGWWPQSTGSWFEPSQYGNLVLAGSAGAQEGRSSRAGLVALGLGRPRLALELGSASWVKLELYDVSGRLVGVPFQGRLGPGVHTFALGKLKPGVYAARALVGEKSLKVKFVVN